jgi:hypothetical protein
LVCDNWTNSPIVSAMGWAHHIDHYLYQQYLEAALDNDGDPFVWTSNFQVISKVYLEKHLSLPRTYLLNRNMVQQGMAKMVEPE